jgi:hypothetical protein
MTQEFYTRPCSKCKNNDPDKNSYMWFIECCAKGISMYDRYIKPVDCEDFEIR